MYHSVYPRFMQLTLPRNNHRSSVSPMLKTQSGPAKAAPSSGLTAPTTTSRRSLVERTRELVLHYLRSGQRRLLHLVQTRWRSLEADPVCCAVLLPAGSAQELRKIRNTTAINMPEPAQWPVRAVQAPLSAMATVSFRTHYICPRRSRHSVLPQVWLPTSQAPRHLSLRSTPTLLNQAAMPS